MKTARYIFLLAAAAAAFSGCNDGIAPDSPDNGGGNGEEETPVIPEIPDEINEENVFTVDFFTDLGSEESFFATRDWEDAVSHIQGQEGKVPVAYMFDRTDFETGKANPAVQIAYETGYWPYFVQTESTSDITEGTGLVTPYQIEDFDSVVPGEGVFMSGVTIPVPLEKSVYTGIYTTTLTEAGQFSVIASQWTGSRLNSGVTVGKISSGIKEAVSETAAKDFPSLRLFYAGTEGSAYDLFVLCPAVFACREFEEGADGKLPYWRIHIEKIY